MHLGNSIICPVTGIPMIVVMGAAAIWAWGKCRRGKCDDNSSPDIFTKDKILPTVMLTSLVFGLQMINFSIPTTASSGHIIGAILLSALLGPYVAFLSMCSILLVQSLFFADGGILALGCNIFNMGFLACFVAYPLYKKICGDRFQTTMVFSSKVRPFWGIILSTVVALQLGSIAVVVESAMSGSISIVNIDKFAELICSIHLIIGVVEGIVTAGIVTIAQKTNLSTMFSYVTGGFALILAGIISNYASTKPDGLEWSLLNMSDSFVAQTQGQIYAISEAIQTKTAILTSVPSIGANIIGVGIIMLLTLCVFSLVSRKCLQTNSNQ